MFYRLGERPGGSPGAPEEVPPPREAPRRREAQGETLGNAAETRPPPRSGHDSASKPMRSVVDWLKRATRGGKGRWAVSSLPDARRKPMRQIPLKQKEDYEPHTHHLSRFDY
ncbi:hypothetical protein CSUB_C1533 [Candidatus Caldarchaeum subterraneum]|uniref:Uncharacterized protein n=1 Tax=Caldiarchaeum subterraneum TaxID=311458 RepID=E6N8R2_CALS0|nr:hypothetical protein HGMM_F40F12C06 [Candidatus Caldarchaeum subterraneum]BAJ49715.1 hypothetical protein HGMM_F28H09C17 [Candidatus Caldarchaeum subterraneum]BAJ51384.1 hypothetical protein CSUB_C1533 [Candidatus Caldarchaeum subterraneum]